MSKVVGGHSNDLWELLKAIGAPDHCIEFKLTARVNEVVTAEATYYPSLDLDENGELQKAVKRYRLVEIQETEALEVGDGSLIPYPRIILPQLGPGDVFQLQNGSMLRVVRVTNDLIYFETVKSEDKQEG